MLAAAHSPAELVQLRQPESLGVLDDHHRGVRHIDADLDDRRRDEHVHVAAREGRHHAILLVGLQAPVQQRHLEFRKHLGLQVVGHFGGGAQIDAFDDSSTSG